VRAIKTCKSRACFPWRGLGGRDSGESGSTLAKVESGLMCDGGGGWVRWTLGEAGLGRCGDGDGANHMLEGKEDNDLVVGLVLESWFVMGLGVGEGLMVRWTLMNYVSVPWVLADTGVFDYCTFNSTLLLMCTHSNPSSSTTKTRRQLEAPTLLVMRHNGLSTSLRRCLRHRLPPNHP
jgi:hypothetical protein